MARGVDFTERSAQRISRSVLFTERLRRGQLTQAQFAAVAGRNDGVQWLSWRNDENAECPAHAVVEVTGIVFGSDGLLDVTGQQSNGDFTLPLGVNTLREVAADQYGALTFAPLVEVLYDDADTPMLGESWGPEADSWKLHKGREGFTILGGIDVQKGTVRALRGVTQHVFPITLSQTGGSQGTNSTAASWTYTVTHAISGKELATGVNPVSSPHTYNRPSSGQLSTADAGYAHYDGADLVIGYINERPGPGACA